MRIDRTVLLAFFAAFTFGQTTTDADLAQAAKNPYDLARYIDSHPTIDWTALEKTWRVPDFPGMPRCEPGFWHCTVDLLTVFKPAQVILTVQGVPMDVFLRFLQDGAGWRLAGSHAADKKNFGGRHEITRIGHKPFLRVSSQGASGSNWDSEYEMVRSLTTRFCTGLRIHSEGE